MLLTACDPNLTDPEALGPYETRPGTPLSCLPNLDGRIDWHELSPTLDIPASYLVSPYLDELATTGRMVDVVGHVGEDGRRVWDWSRAEPSDRLASITARPLTDQWFASHFPDGELAVAMDAGETLLGVYSHDETALRLHGYASALDGGEKTLVVYEEPIDFFSFPLEVGTSWTTTARVRNATMKGLAPWSQDEVYENEVDAAGELRLPDFTFAQALRLRTKVTIKPLALGEQYGVRQVTFVFECFGEVARASSAAFEKGNDPGPDFTVAREVRKLGFL